MSTVSATSRGRQLAGAAPLSTPDAGPTVMLTVTYCLRSKSSETIRWRASAVSGAADEYFSGGWDSRKLSGLPLSPASGYSNWYARIGS